MKGRQSDEFLEVLGYKYVEEIVHREDLVLLDVKNNTGESVDDNGASVDDNAESFDAGENRG